MKGLAVSVLLWLAPAIAVAQSAEGAAVAADSTTSDTRSEVVVSQEFALAALEAKISRDVEERMRERQDFYWAVAAAVGTVLIGFFGFVGLGQLQGMRKQIREGLFSELQESIIRDEGFRSSIERTVSQTLVGETRDQFTEVSRQVALNRLASLSAKVEAGTGFSDYEKNALIEGLFILKDSKSITASNEFKESLGNVVRSFSAAHLDQELDQIHETLGEQTLEGDFKVALHMLLNYAFRVIGAGAPSSVEKDRFVRYAAALKRLRRYEDALPYLMIACESDRLRDLNVPAYKELQLEFRHLTDDEKRTCASIIFNYAEAKDPPPTPRHERVRDAFITFVQKHGNEYQKWKQAAEVA
jgi:hypothetical protein